jgi:hypothetical protein
VCREMRILCRCAGGTPHTCKPLKLRPFAPAGTCWAQQELSPYDNALRYAHDQGLDFQGMRVSRAADSRKRSVSIKGRFDQGATMLWRVQLTRIFLWLSAARTWCSSGPMPAGTAVMQSVVENRVIIELHL